jgi:hypothetical protein
VCARISICGRDNRHCKIATHQRIASHRSRAPLWTAIDRISLIHLFEMYKSVI